MDSEKNYILLIDDELELRECIAEFLEDEGYRVIQAENGLVALEFLKHNSPPCMILLDYMMPVMDGKMFCEALKKEMSIDSIPIILLSAAKVPDEAFNSMNVVEQLDKPIHIESFLNVAKKYCN